MALPLLGDFRGSPQQVYGRPDWDLIFRAFVDVGRTERNGRNATAGERNQTLLSAGIGAELQVLSNFRARIDWAAAIEDEFGTFSNDRNAVQRGDSEIHALFSIIY